MIDPMSNLVDELKITDCVSGEDIDIWGHPTPPPTVQIPRPGDDSDCPLKEDGRCVCCPGREVCEQFRREWEREEGDRT